MNQNHIKLNYVCLNCGAKHEVNYGHRLASYTCSTCGCTNSIRCNKTLQDSIAGIKPSHNQYIFVWVHRTTKGLPNVSTPHVFNDHGSATQCDVFDDSLNGINRCICDFELCHNWFDVKDLYYRTQSSKKYGQFFKKKKYYYVVIETNKPYVEFSDNIGLKAIKKLDCGELTAELLDELTTYMEV